VHSPLSITSLHQAAVPCSDLARSVAFYRDTLGLPLIAQFSPPGLAFFALGNTRLLVDAAGGSADAKRAAGVLYLRVADIHAAARELRARGVALDAEPHAIFRDVAGTFGAASEEEWMAFFRDPDGNLLALAARMRPAP
jgi:catechol 2,3-dioxygenase-like lactoylglutathione lyase family enzyme